MIRTGLSVAVLLGASLAAGAVAADPSGDTYSVQWENDRIANTDRHYTNGFRLS